MRESMASVGRFLLAGALLGAASFAQAQMTPAQSLIQDKFVLNLGGFIVGTDVTAQSERLVLDQPGHRLRPDLRQRQRLRPASAPMPLWRITPNHHLRFLYFNNTDDGTRAIDRNIAWGDYTFQAGATVESKTKFQICELAYEYAFWRRPTSRSRAASAFTT